jgi:acyl-coenzyme A synthetase/AMP-(fatty) acid ligase
MNLYDFLSKHPSDLRLVLSQSESWSAGQVLDGLDGIRRRLVGVRCAIRLASVGESLRTIAALDGVAEAILLIAPSVPSKDVSAMLQSANVKVLVTDDDDPAISEGFAKIVRRIEDCTVSQGASPERTTWILATSGTSGDSKLVAHSLDTLIKTTKLEPRPGAEVRWGLLFEWARFAGLQILLQSVISGSTLLAPTAGTPLEEQIAFFRTSGCTHLSATPSMWRKIAMLPGGDQLSLKQISLGGEIADDRVISVLGSMFPTSRITHIYASTEAGVGFSVNDRKAGFPASYLENPPQGIELRVVDGILQVRNSGVAPAYVGSNILFGSAEGWIITGDRVIVDPTRVHFLGRDNGVINVGGNKVHPEQVERVLLEFPGVAAARVFGKRSPITGSLVVAEIALRQGQGDPDSVRERLLRYASTRLEGHMVPAVVTVVTEVEISSTGKVARAEK